MVSEGRKFVMKKELLKFVVICVVLASGIAVSYAASSPRVTSGEFIQGAATCNCSGELPKTCKVLCESTDGENEVTRCKSGTTGACSKDTSKGSDGVYDCGFGCKMNFEKCD